MILAPEEIDHDDCDVSAILEGLWCATAELNEMVQ